VGIANGAVKQLLVQPTQGIVTSGGMDDISTKMQRIKKEPMQGQQAIVPSGFQLQNGFVCFKGVVGNKDGNELGLCCDPCY